MDTTPVFDDDIELPGVDAEETKAPQQVEIDDLDIPGDPDSIQVETVEEEAVEYQAPAVQALKYVQAEPIPDVVAAVMTQLSMKAGLKAWGDKALSEVKSEMK